MVLIGIYYAVIVAIDGSVIALKVIGREGGGSIDPRIDAGGVAAQVVVAIMYSTASIMLRGSNRH